MLYVSSIFNCQYSKLCLDMHYVHISTDNLFFDRFFNSWFKYDNFIADKKHDRPHFIFPSMVMDKLWLQGKTLKLDAIIQLIIEQFVDIKNIFMEEISYTCKKYLKLRFQKVCLNVKTFRCDKCILCKNSVLTGVNILLSALALLLLF